MVLGGQPTPFCFYPLFFDIVDVHRRLTRRKELVTRPKTLFAAERNAPSIQLSSNQQSRQTARRKTRRHLSPAAPFSLETLRKTHSALRVEDFRETRIHHGGYILWKYYDCTHMVVEDVDGNAPSIQLSSNQQSRQTARRKTRRHLSPAAPFSLETLRKTHSALRMEVSRGAEEARPSFRSDVTGFLRSDRSSTFPWPR